MSPAKCIALWALIPAFMAKKKGRSFLGFYVLSLLISPLITMIIAACVSNKNADAEQPVNGTENGSDLPDNVPVQVEQTPAAGAGRYCPNCGSSIPEDSKFCGNCGTRFE